MERVSESYINTLIQRLSKSGWVDGSVVESNDSYISCLIVLLNNLTDSFDKNFQNIISVFPFRSEQFAVSEFNNVMANLNYIGRKKRKKVTEISSFELPCLFVPADKESEPFLMLQNGDNIAVFSGKKKEFIPAEKISEIVGSCYSFEYVADEHLPLSRVECEVAGRGWFELLLKRFKPIFYQCLLLTFVVNLLALAVPLFIMGIYSKVIVHQNTEVIFWFGMGVLFALAVEYILRSVRTNCVYWLSGRVGYIVNNAVVKHLLSLSAAHIENAEVSAQVARIKSFELLRDFLSGSLFLSLLELPFILITLFVIAMIAGPVVWVPIVLLLIYAVLVVVSYVGITEKQKRMAKYSAEKQRSIIGYINKITSLRSAGLTEVAIRKIDDVSVAAMIAQFKFLVSSMLINLTSRGLMLLAGVLVVYFSVHQIWAQQMNAGALVACMFLVWRALSPMQTICASISRFSQVKNNAKQVSYFLNVKNEKPASHGYHQIYHLKGNVQFQKVGLRYVKEHEPVFSGLSFDVKPGELVAIVGSNGSGKSTLLKLINRLYAPQAGTILLDDMDIRQFDPVELRQFIGYMPQIPSVFTGTIADNIRLVSPFLTDEEIMFLLDKAGARQVVESLPNGIYTEMNKEEANTTSTTLAYQVSMARVYCKMSPMLLFDELPYSLLNETCGYNYFESLKNWRRIRTVFYVTHRQDYIRLADKVVLLRTGKMPLVMAPEEAIDFISDENNREIYHE